MKIFSFPKLFFLFYLWKFDKHPGHRPKSCFGKSRPSKSFFNCPALQQSLGFPFSNWISGSSNIKGQIFLNNSKPSESSKSFAVPLKKQLTAPPDEPGSGFSPQISYQMQCPSLFFWPKTKICKFKKIAKRKINFIFFFFFLSVDFFPPNFDFFQIHWKKSILKDFLKKVFQFFKDFLLKKFEVF